MAVFSLEVAYSHANTTSCQFSIPSQVALVETRFEQGLAGCWERVGCIFIASTELINIIFLNPHPIYR